jgi:glycosyltransferase A (GT-A) superfamily protein (DUF2064 family)
MRPAILLFARSPEREASAKRMRFAAPLFRALVASWLDAARRHEAKPVIACAEEDREALASIAPDIDREWIEQRGATFGERVASATDEAFARGFDAVLIAAIDAPPHDLREAFAKLAEGTPVVSPSRDGGINFIGLVRPERELLAQLELGRRDLLAFCARYFAVQPRGGETPPVQPPRTAAFHIIRSTIDVDDEHALNIAKTDRAWRGLLPRTDRPQTRNHAVASSRRASPSSPRAPPA